jgi:hypothetical protein
LSSVASSLKTVSARAMLTAMIDAELGYATTVQAIAPVRGS